MVWEPPRGIASTAGPNPPVVLIRSRVKLGASQPELSSAMSENVTTPSVASAASAAGDETRIVYSPVTEVTAEPATVTGW